MMVGGDAKAAVALMKEFISVINAVHAGRWLADAAKRQKPVS
jgi:hypothetical protein